MLDVGEGASDANEREEEEEDVGEEKKFKDYFGDHEGGLGLLRHFFLLY